MDRTPVLVFPIFLFVIFSVANGLIKDDIRDSLAQFMGRLSAGNVVIQAHWGWNLSSDPCVDKWMGVKCDDSLQSVKKIVLESLNFSGVLDADSLCRANSINVLSLIGNNVGGGIPEEISNCRRLTHLYLKGNRFSGGLPGTLPALGDLKRLDISDNNFDGKLPDLARISGMISFLAQNNHLEGELPGFDLTNFEEFNVSNNNLVGPIPDVKGHFKADSFLGNPGLCGQPLPNSCPPSKPKADHNHWSVDRFLIYLGYIVLGLIIVLLLAVKLFKRTKSREENTSNVKERSASDTNSSKLSSSPGGFKTSENRSEYSITSVESGRNSAPLVVLRSPGVSNLKFEDLLRAPAELLGRGKNGSLYKVMLGNGQLLAVKRIKECPIPSEEFKLRMHKMDRVRNVNVLPPIAFYCSKQEKLIVYEYQPNGSLLQLLHGVQNGQIFDWGSRLAIAASIAKALAFMHEEFHDDGIPHGSLKSTNILFDKDMEPCISEYGLMLAETKSPTTIIDISGDQTPNNIFKVDVYGFGLILLELLTGKMVQNNGYDLARWVHSVVTEEWTVEVFDKVLVSEGASEERMLSLLQVALRCISPSRDERPNMKQVLVMINTIKEEEERSISSES